MVNSLDRTTEFRAFSSLYLDEGHGAISLDHQIDVAMPIPEAPLDHPPATPPQPPLRYPLSQLPERLPGC